MNKLFILLSFLCFIVAPAWAEAPMVSNDWTKTFNAEHATLSNGMEVYTIPNMRIPVVTHMVWYKVGSADEKWGKSGLAHFLEHLLFKGSDNVPSGEFSKIVKRLGGQDNAFTSYDYTAYFQTVTRDHLETVMTMEADRMDNILLPEDEVLAERSVVIEERRQRTDNKPINYFHEQLLSALFTNHPYGVPVIGWMNEIEKLSSESARAFYDQWYRPDNAILIVSGHITMDELLPLAEKTYGQIEASGPLPDRNWPAVPPFIGDAKYELHDDTVKERKLFRIYRAPSYAQDKDTSLTLQVLESIIDSGSTTRLYKSLVVDQKLAVNIGMSYISDSLSDSKIWLSAVPSEGVDMETLEKAIDAELRDIAENGVLDAELSEAKKRLQDQAIFARDSIAGPAMIFGRMLTTGASLSDIEYWPNLIEGVTKEDVQSAVQNYLYPFADQKPHFVTGYVLPKTPDTQAEGAE